jgi:hypothetical protein
VFRREALDELLLVRRLSRRGKKGKMYPKRLNEPDRSRRRRLNGDRRSERMKGGL